MEKPVKKHYAFVEHETVQAMLHSLFRFKSLEQAQLITNRFALEFTLAPKLSDPLDKKSFALWVRGFEITEDEQKLGYLGNFGRITIHRLPTGKWTLSLTKIDAPLNKHPQRKPVPRRHPNMGHPVIRAASRAKSWPSMQEAAAQLMKLHEEFPEISVPGLNKLKIMTYVKSEKGVSPVKRLELQVVKRGEGDYILDIRSNLRKPAPILPPPKPASETIPQAEQPPPDKAGFYANLVTKGRKRKKK